MNIRTKLPVAAFAAAFLAAAPAAATVTFTLTGDATAQFTLPSSPTPSDVGTQSFTLGGQSGSYNGIAGVFDLIFYLDGLGGGFDLLDQFGGQATLGAFGPQIFTGGVATPTFLTGTFEFTNNDDAAFYSLTIANANVVPEPESWALLIAGFGLTGAAMRRRRNSRRQSTRSQSARQHA